MGFSPRKHCFREFSASYSVVPNVLAGNTALAAEGVGSRIYTGFTSLPARASQKRWQATALHNHVSGYLRAKRSKSAIWRSISSRAASAAERMP